DEYFHAIARLDNELGQHYELDEPGLGSLEYHIGEAEFSVGDFELSYRMHKRAGRAIEAVIEGNVDEETRNTGIYRLAKIYFQKNQPVNALHVIERIEGALPGELKAETVFLEGQINIANGRFARAVELLKKVEGEESVVGFAAYNLAIALMQVGEEKKGLLKLEQVGSINTADKAVLAIRDKANLVLGYKLLEKKYADLAKPYFERVRLQGPFSNRALLGAGWADMAQEKFDRAVVPWTILHQRNITDASVQEAMMGLPYAYSKLGIHGKAAVLYGRALEMFSAELDRLVSSIVSIREGRFLEALMREEYLREPNWLLALRKLENAPETLYLMDLMASHDFQESLKNYRDLTILKRYLESWLGDLDAYEEMIKIRRHYYEPLLPGVEKSFASLDSRMRLRLEQSTQLNKRVNSMTIMRRPDFLASVSERRILDRVNGIEDRLQGSTWVDPEYVARLQRVKGVINWQIMQEYDERHTSAFKSLRQLEGIVEQLESAYNDFVRTRQSASQSYVGYEKPIGRLRVRIKDMQTRLDTVLSRQGYILEMMAVNELEKRKLKLEEYQIKARFALAESYDRAQKTQSDAETAAIQKAIEERMSKEADENQGEVIEVIEEGSVKESVEEPVETSSMEDQGEIKGEKNGQD
ncbi:MAG: hypothetical protein OEZ23_08640, partial [Gammaproteobacteria bacterium]|nr:hypothetical protein [Gammaproteobacteria bacterium]